MNKVTIIAIVISAMMFIVMGCEENTVYVSDPQRPATPMGLTSITGDGAIKLLWYPVEMDDIDYYVIYWAPGSANPADPDEYDYLTSVSSNRTSWTDYDVINGNTYYYTMTAVNFAGMESYMSNYAMDTPRPDGYGVHLYDYHMPDTRHLSGYDLYYHERVSYLDVNCDFYLDYDSILEAFFITVRHNDYFIQDYGYAADFDDVGYAPPDGWSAFADVEAIEGHIYMLKLRHFDEWHYAKIWITDLDYGYRTMEFSWAYQTDPYNQELSIPLNPVMPKNESREVN